MKIKSEAVVDTVIAIIIVICVIAAILAVEGCSRPEPSEGKDPIGAFVMCQHTVTRQLRAPSTAVFPMISAPGVSSRHLGGGMYEVRGYVDAQNSFGSPLRTYWDCEIKQTSDDKWQPLKLEM